MDLHRPLDKLGLIELGRAVGERLALEREGRVRVHLLVVARVGEGGCCEQQARQEGLECHGVGGDLKLTRLQIEERMRVGGGRERLSRSRRRFPPGLFRFVDPLSVPPPLAPPSRLLFPSRPCPFQPSKVCRSCYE